ncbi:hypothetical protein F01_410107 [Burkholderia cenocepacia]|nr:hypothetical protein F01_410107 [Burkholderia cenocepacia]
MVRSGKIRGKTVNTNLRNSRLFCGAEFEMTHRNPRLTRRRHPSYPLKNVFQMERRNGPCAAAHRRSPRRRSPVNELRAARRARPCIGDIHAFCRRRRRARGRQPLSLDRLCAAVFRDRDQLYGSADPRPARADAPARHRLEPGAVRPHRDGVFGVLCARPARLRAHRRLARHARVVRGGDAGMEHRRDAACGGRLGDGLRIRARAARHRRGRQLPCRDQDHGRMVSAPRTRARHGHLQLGREHRRGVRAGDHPGDRGGLRLARGVRDHRRDRYRMARRMACDVSHRRHARARRGIRRAARRSRSARRGERGRRRAALGRADPQARDVGVPGRQVPDRSGVVVLPVLAAEVAQRVARDGHAAHRLAARLHLCADDGRQHRRRLAVVDAAARRLEREPCAQDGDADLRMLRAADRVRVAGAEPVGRGADRRPCRRRAPGLVGEPVHDGVRPVPAPRGRVGGRHRRDGRLDRRRAVLGSDRPGAAAHRPLLGAVRDRRIGLPDRAGRDARAHAEDEARETRRVIAYPQAKTPPSGGVFCGRGSRVPRTRQPAGAVDARMISRGSNVE